MTQSWRATADLVRDRVAAVRGVFERMRTRSANRTHMGVTARGAPVPASPSLLPRIPAGPYSSDRTPSAESTASDRFFSPLGKIALPRAGRSAGETMRPARPAASSRGPAGALASRAQQSGHGRGRRVTADHQGDRSDHRRADQRPVDDGIEAQLLQTLGDERQSQTGGDQTDDRGELRCLLHYVRIEPGGPTGGEDVVEQSGADRARKEDERLGAQVGQRNRRRRGARMRCRQGDHERLLQQREHGVLSLRVAQRRTDERRVDSAVEHGAQLFRRVHLGEAEHDPRVRRLIAAEHVEHDRGEGAGAGIADAQVAGFTPPRSLRRQRRPLGLHQQSLRFRLQHAAGLAQFDVSFAPPEQGHAQRSLQFADLLRQRRLRHAQTFGSAAEVQLSGNGEKVAELAQLHRRKTHPISKKLHRYIGSTTSQPPSLFAKTVRAKRTPMTSDRRSLGIVLAGAAAFSDLYAPQSILPQIAVAFGVSAHRAGWVITVTTLAVALIGPVAGALADAFGRKRLIAAGALAMVVPTTMAALAATFPELLIWRAVAGLLMPLIFCVAVAHIGEEWDADEARAMTALYMAGAGAGGFFGRFFTGVMTDALGWRVAFAGLGAVNLAIGLALLVTLPRERSFVASSGVRMALTPDARALASTPHARRL